MPSITSATPWGSTQSDPVWFMGRGKRPISGRHLKDRVAVFHLPHSPACLVLLSPHSCFSHMGFPVSSHRPKVIPLSGPCLCLCQECSYPPGSLVSFKSQLKCHFFVRPPPHHLHQVFPGVQLSFLIYFLDIIVTTEINPLCFGLSPRHSN